MILTGLVLVQIGLMLLQTAILIGAIGAILSRQSKRDSILSEEIGQMRYQLGDLLISLKKRESINRSESPSQSFDKMTEQSASDQESERFRDHPAPPLGTHINLSGK